MLFIGIAFSLQNIGTTWLIAFLITFFFLMIYCIKAVGVKLPMRIIKRDTGILLNAEDENFASAASASV